MLGLLCLAVLSAAYSPARAAYLGFNYGAFFGDYSPKLQTDFEADFELAQRLVGAPAGGFTSARLYTMIQYGTPRDVISAIPAAIATNTSLLLGMWCSAGDAVFDNELTALKTAVDKYGDNFTHLVVGISVGSEDLYRISPTGQQNNAGAGAEPATIAKYIDQVRKTVSGTKLTHVPVGHVDTWTVWVNGSNSAVRDASDFIGMNAFPYWEAQVPNAVDKSQTLFEDALDQTGAAAHGKPVWVTETGFPISGHTSNHAVASVDNAGRYWRDVGCALFGGDTNVWWYTLRDAGRGATPEPSFGITRGDLGTTPLFDISCAQAGPSCDAS